MKILFVDGGNPARGHNEHYNLSAAVETAIRVKRIIGSKRAVVAYSNSLDADRTAKIIAEVNDWPMITLEEPALRPLPDSLTMYRVNKIISDALGDNLDVVFVLCFADIRVRAMLHLFKVMMDASVEMPNSPIGRATFNIYAVDTSSHVMENYVSV